MSDNNTDNSEEKTREMLVVDPDGVELGYINSEEEDVFVVAEGPFGFLLLDKELGKIEDDKLILNDDILTVLEGKKVFDHRGDEMGVVEEAIVAEKILDSIIVREKNDNLLTVILEDIYAISSMVILDLTKDEAEAEDLHPGIITQIKNALNRD